LDQAKDELATIMNQEIGKDIKESIVEIERTVEYMNATVKAWPEIQEVKQNVGKKHSRQIRVSLGVVLAISPFNYPVNLSLAKIIPALLVGNTVVFKAASNGSLTGGFIAKLFAETNIPAGVFNYVSGAGRDIGDILTSHKNISMISFTGSVGVGKNIASMQPMKPIVLELGGNDAAYIRHDANLDKAAKEVASGAFSYSGQRCTAIKRLIIHKSIYEDFIEKLIAETKKLNIVPLINEKAASFVKELYEDSIQTGGKDIIKPIFKDNIVTQGIILTNKKSRL